MLLNLSAFHFFHFLVLRPPLSSPFDVVNDIFSLWKRPVVQQALSQVYFELKNNSPYLALYYVFVFSPFLYVYFLIFYILVYFVADCGNTVITIIPSSSTCLCWLSIIIFSITCLLPTFCSVT